MVYIINNYDGTQLVGIADRTVNSTATSLKLPGRDYEPYGEVMVENMLWMLQNFSGSAPPLRPIEGQIWYDTSLKVIKVFDSSQWQNVGKAIMYDDFPSDVQEGQIFYHTTKSQLYLKTATSWKLIAPVGSADGTDESPASQINHTQLEALQLGQVSLLKMSVGGVCVAVVSPTGPVNTAPGDIPGFTPTTLNAGINLNTGMQVTVN